MAEGATSMEGYNSEKVYEMVSMEEEVLGVKCGIAEWIRKTTLR